MTPFFPHEYIASRAADHGVTVEQLHGKSRRPKLVQARVQIARELKARSTSYKRIGALLNKHHTTIIHYVRRAA